MEEKQPSEKETKTGSENPAGEKEVKKLTPEEQMAAYEKDLKENDWGHQPC